MSKLRGYLSSLRENFKLTRKVHRWVGLEMLAIFLGATAIVALPVSFFLNWLTGLLVGLPVGLLAMTYWFSRRAMNAAYSQIEGQAGAGLVKVTMNCKNQVKSVSIDPSLMTPDSDDRETLQDLLAAAVNDAVSKAEAISQQRMSAVTAGLPLPPGMKLPF